LSGIASLVTGAISAVTGVIGVFQAARQENTLNAIEESTRYTKILIEQNLNVIAVQSVLQTGNLDNIKTTLWTARDKLVDIAKGSFGGSSGGGAGSITFNNCTFNGITPGSVTQMGQALAQEIRLAGHA
jgi:hypothetical protein